MTFSPKGKINTTKKPFRIKIILFLVFFILLGLVITNFVILPILSPRVFGSPSDLSSIVVLGKRPFLGVAKLFCEIRGRSFVEIDLYKDMNGNGWTCVPKIPPISCSEDGICALKPVIYLYPQTKTEVNVKLNFSGTLVVDYPKYDSIRGWEVIAFPDGKLVNKIDGKEYNYLFWEGILDQNEYDLSKGFVVEGERTADFLQEVLEEMGLTPREYNEFIVYWYPKMKSNKYNLIYFANEEYTERVSLDVYPFPDSVLRIFMVYRPVGEKIAIEPQKFKKLERKGFTVVEWGGTEID